MSIRRSEQKAVITARIADMRARAATKPHGTRSRYIAGCRCEDCKAVQAAYRKVVYDRHKRGERNPLVPIDKVRAYIKKLSAHGVGNRSIAEIAGLQVAFVSALRAGRKQHVRQATETAILAIGLDAATGRARIDAAPTWKILDELIERGYSKAQLARWLGMKTPDLQINKKVVTAETAAKVRRMAALLDAGKLKRK